ncbi:MAG: uroporphyrinogen decarboxylase family protein [Eubacteriales bacterium]|jgi:hypothetical protein|nr:uroporphyrinogen decarboxylase family protein [Eubacteriales bacterium]
MEYTEDEINARKKRWNALLSGSEGAQNIVTVGYLPGLGPRAFITDGRYEVNFDWAADKYRIMTENVGRIPDDTVPFLDMTTGTEIFAEAFGCRVVYPDNNNPFALPKIDDVSGISRLRVPDLWNTRLAGLFDMAYGLRRATDMNALLKLPDIQSPLDIAALIMNKEAFYVAMLEEPEAVRELTYKTRTLLTRFLDEWFGAFGREFVAHHPDYYMEYGVTLSEDEIGAFGSELFSELVSGELNALSDRYGRIGIHCCADAVHQWHNLKKTKHLCLLNLNQPPHIIEKAYAFFGGSCCHMHSFYSARPADTWREHFAGKRVIFQFYANSLEEAQHLTRMIKGG